jgi:hypothetical protein
VEGTNPVQLKAGKTPVLGSQPSWGWDNTIVYVGSENTLIKTDPEGRNHTPLGVTGLQPAVSPSSNWVAFSSTDNVLNLVSTEGIVYGHYSTEISCTVPEWDPTGQASVCDQMVVGLSYVLGETISLPIYQDGITAVMDPTGSTPYSVLTEKSGDTWLIPDLLNIPAAGLDGQELGTGEYSDWYAPGTLRPTKDMFVNQFTQ